LTSFKRIAKNTRASGTQNRFPSIEPGNIKDVMAGMNPEVLFLGDLNVDLIFSGLESAMQADREAFCSSYSMVPGGSTAIAAAHFARLGGKARLCSLTGVDDFGMFVKKALGNAGVDTSMVQSTPAKGTGVTLNIVEGNARSQLTFPGALSLLTADPSLLEKHDFCHLHLSGMYGMRSLLPQIGTLLRAARAMRISTSLDTQWDPLERWLYLDEWLPLLDYLFVNEAEAASISGHEDHTKAWLTLSTKTACPIIKLGSKGAYATGVHFPARPVKVVDTTGAGDAFAAGFLAGRLLRNLDTGAAIKAAIESGAWACTHRGGFPDPDDPGTMQDFSSIYGT